MLQSLCFMNSKYDRFNTHQIHVFIWIYRSMKFREIADSFKKMLNLSRENKNNSKFFWLKCVNPRSKSLFRPFSTFSCDSCQMWYLLQSIDDLCAVEFQSMYLQNIVTIIYKLAKCGILRNFQVECLHSCKRWWNKREWWTALIKNSTTNDGNFDILLNPNMC